MPVKLTGVHFSFWSGLKVMGLAVPNASAGPAASEADGGRSPAPSAATAPNFLEAPKISARILWGPLLARRLVVRELVIESPTVVWAQTSKGKWRLPKEKDETKSGKTPGEKRRAQTGDLAESPSATAKPENPEIQAKPASQASKKLEFKIQTARIENATFRFMDRENEPVAVFEGVTVNCPTVGVDQAQGEVTIRKLTLHNQVVVENITTPFAFVDGLLNLPQVDARLAGGSVRGAYKLHPVDDGAPFTLDLLFDGVDLNQLLTSAQPPGEGQKMAGTLHGSLDLYGRSGQKKSIGGIGQLVLHGGRMEQYPLLQIIGQALQIDELTRLELRQAQVDLRVGENRVFVDSLVLESANLSLTASGETRFDGRLDLDAGLAVDPKITRQLPNWVAVNFKPVEGSERKMIHFGINGTLQHPGTDLLEVMVGEKYQKQANDLFQAFRALTGNSGKKKKKSDGEKKSGEKKSSKASAEPSPSEPPSQQQP